MSFKITRRALNNYIKAAVVYLLAFVLITFLFKWPFDILLLDFSSVEVVFVLNIFGFIVLSFIYYTIYFFINVNIASNSKYTNYLSLTSRIVHALLASALSIILCYVEFLLYEYLNIPESDKPLFWSEFGCLFWTLTPILLATNIFNFIVFKPRA